MEGLFSAVAQLDNENKAERTSQCMVTKALDGWYPVKAPYGYQNDKATKTIIRDPYYFEPVQKIFQLFAEGHSIPELVAHLDNLGIVTRGSKLAARKSFTTKSVWKNTQ